MKSFAVDVQEALLRATGPGGAARAPAFGLLRSNVPARAGRMTLDTFRPAHPAQATALEAARRLSGGERRWPVVYFSGPARSGKTHLLWAIARHRSPVGRSGTLYLAGRSWKALVRRARRRGQSERLEEACATLELLLVDGVEELRGSPSAQWSLARVIDRRSARGRLAVLSGPAHPFQLPLSERLQDRLGAGVVLSLGPK